MIQEDIDTSNDDNLNLVCVMEECGELIQELSKNIRGKGNYINTIEELTDVILGIEYVKLILKPDAKDLDKMMELKLLRLQKILESKRES